jgi:hypothetical protein
MYSCSKRVIPSQMAAFYLSLCFYRSSPTCPIHSRVARRARAQERRQNYRFQDELGNIILERVSRGGSTQATPS